MDADILVRVLHKSGSLHFTNTEQQLENTEENPAGSVCSRSHCHLVEMKKLLQEKRVGGGHEVTILLAKCSTSLGLV